MYNPISARLSIAAIVVANGTALAERTHRVGGFIQNLAALKLYVKKGAGCSASDFTAILVGGSAEDDGYGGSFPIGDYSGIVTIFSTGTPRCVVSEDIA